MSRKAKDRTALEDRIGYKFADKNLLEHALTHISALSGGNRAASYQRLEFLGDHVLGLVISDMLYRTFPKANEGELSRRLADLVRKETCAEVARAMDLGPVLKLGNSESHAGGRRRMPARTRRPRTSEAAWPVTASPATARGCSGTTSSTASMHR